MKRQIVLEKEQADYIYRVSYLSLVSCLYSLYRNHYSLSIVPGSVFLSSINYWRKPDYSWRRYADMIVVKCALIYQTYIVYNTSPQYEKIYNIFMILSVLAYPLGIYYHKKGDLWKSLYSHMMIHIFSNTANIILYSGSIWPQIE